MAQELEGLPDLWHMVQRLMTRLRELFSARWKSRRGPAPESAQSRQTPAPQATTPEPERVIATVRSTTSSYPKPRFAAPVQAAPAQLALTTKLRDKRFLRQAVMVNEILDRPLALRRQRVWRRR